MIKINSKAVFGEVQGCYAVRFSLDISPNSEYNNTKFQIEIPLTQDEYTSVKKSIQPGKINFNIEGILEAMASVEV